MTKHKITVREVRYRTYHIDTDKTDREDIEEEFYSMSETDQNEILKDADCYSWEITGVEKLDD